MGGTWEIQPANPGEPRRKKNYAKELENLSLQQIQGEIVPEKETLGQMPREGRSSPLIILVEDILQNRYLENEEHSEKVPPGDVRK